MRAMWLQKGVPKLIPVLLLAGLLVGCAASLNNGSLNRDELAASNGVTPLASNGITPPGGNAPAAQAADQVMAVATPGNAAYKIGPMDVLDISVFKVPELSRTVNVSDTGTDQPAPRR